MNITVVTIRVPNKSSYDNNSVEWVESYKKYKPQIKHDLIVVNSDSDWSPSVYDEVATDFVRYDGGGWDCGTWTFIWRAITTDVFICCNTSTFFTGHGWMERFLDAIDANGVGLYGPMISFEISKHVRSPCMVFQPEIIKDYPYIINSRQETYTFECAGQEKTFTNWHRRNGGTVKLVTWDGVYDIEDARKPNNIFRRGDQSNVIIKDRHCKAYEESSDEGKLVLERLADGM